MLTRRHALLAPTLVLAGAASRTPVAATPISRLETSWWRRRFEAKLAEMRSRPIDLVWYGDSITENWERDGPPAYFGFAPAWQHYYGDRRALNLGFKGDSTAHLLWRLRNGQAEGISPRVAVVLIGANNLGLAHWDAEQTLAGIAAVLDEIRSRLPRTHVLLLPVLPSIRSAWATKQTGRIDHGLAQRYGSTEDVTYVDATGPFLRDGKADPSQFYDPLLDPPEPALHPTAEAQARLAAVIEPTLARLMGDAPKPAFT
jgi:lysophospholipase L1-like esterase